MLPLPGIHKRKELSLKGAPRGGEIRLCSSIVHSRKCNRIRSLPGKCLALAVPLWLTVFHSRHTNSFLLPKTFPCFCIYCSIYSHF
jgi:hypothetical protein